MRTAVVGYCMKVSCLTQLRRHQGFEKVASLTIIVPAGYEWCLVYNWQSKQLHTRHINL